MGRLLEAHGPNSASIVNAILGFYIAAHCLQSAGIRLMDDKVGKFDVDLSILSVPPPVKPFFWKQACRPRKVEPAIPAYPQVILGSSTVSRGIAEARSMGHFNNVFFCQ